MHTSKKWYDIVGNSDLSEITIYHLSKYFDINYPNHNYYNTEYYCTIYAMALALNMQITKTKDIINSIGSQYCSIKMLSNAIGHTKLFYGLYKLNIII